MIKVTGWLFSKVFVEDIFGRAYQVLVELAMYQIIGINNWNR